LKVLSTNIGRCETLHWKGKTYESGINKRQVKEGIFLTSLGVKDDHISETKVHGGKEMACYLFSHEHYPHWKLQYPDLVWEYGMFGENLTLEQFNEKEVCIGDVYKLGETLIQISEVRMPCYKLGIKFGNQGIIKEFIDYGVSGAYLRVLQDGIVKEGDTLKLHQKSKDQISIWDVNQMIYGHASKQMLQQSLKSNELNENIKRKLRKQLGDSAN